MTEIDNLSVDQVESIRQAHLLLAMFNAWQPGVFALSGWDLVRCPHPRPQAGRGAGRLR